MSTAIPRHPSITRFCIRTFAMTGLSAVLAASAHADGPGRGPTAQFESDYLIFIIDHHYSALRMTELAAGTDATRDAAVERPQEGTAPTPGMASTVAKAGADHIRSMARAGNRMQREEIVKAQQFLREWYRTIHAPRLTEAGQRQIQVLEQTPAGVEFDRAFLMAMSNHHYHALGPSQDCLVKADIDHDALKRYCHGIVETQTAEIEEMREQLCKRFRICDFIPAMGLRQQASIAAQR
jgi:uncharacterized protein (DUF305 family)